MGAAEPQFEGIMEQPEAATTADGQDVFQDGGGGGGGDGGGNQDKGRRRAGGLRGRFSALREKANVQDRLLEKLLQQVIPAEYMPAGQVQDTDVPPDSMPTYAQRPGFNLPTMTNNFRRFNGRIGVVFKFQEHVVRLLSWRRYSHTLSFLAVYTLVCLDPYLLAALPIAALLVGVFIPGFLARHPEAPTGGAGGLPANAAYSPRGPPLAPARTLRPARELSSDFFRNMRDLQNCMEDFSRAYDAVVALLVPLTNFGDEARSSAAFVLLAAACLGLTIAAHLVPWRLVFLAAGWGLAVSGHPAVARRLAAARATHLEPAARRARAAFDAWVAADVILDSAPETREVEIFELQRRAAAGTEWEPWVFSPAPWDPLSAPRLAGARPPGTRFFEDVRAPGGWEWSEKKWALDLWSRDWVEERIITGVEVETEGERWVYDMYDEAADQGRAGVVDFDAGSLSGRGTRTAVSWEESLEGMGRRGEWRRRRWVRLVKRRPIRQPIE